MFLSFAKLKKISINLQGIYQNELSDNWRTCLVHPCWDASLGWTFFFWGGGFKYFPETGKADKYKLDVNYRRFAFFFYKNQKVFFNCSLVSLRFTHTKYQPVFSIPFLIWQWPFDKCYPSSQSTCSVEEWAPTSWKWRIQSLSVQSIWCNWNPGTENYNKKNSNKNCS